VVLKIPPIRQPYLSGQELRFVRASVFKKLVDGFQHLPGLHFYIASWLGAVTPQVLTIPLCTTTKLMSGITFTPYNSFTPSVVPIR